MKKLGPLLISLFAVEVALAHTTEPSKKLLPPKISQVKALPPRSQSIALSAEEWQALHIARLKVLTTNPDIVNANQKLNERMTTFEGKLDVAMVKLDPAVAPILAKIEAHEPSGSTTLRAPISSPK